MATVASSPIGLPAASDQREYGYAGRLAAWLIRKAHRLVSSPRRAPVRICGRRSGNDARRRCRRQPAQDGVDPFVANLCLG